MVHHKDIEGPLPVATVSAQGWPVSAGRRLLVLACLAGVAQAHAQTQSQTLQLFDPTPTGTAKQWDAIDTRRANLGVVLGTTAGIALYGKTHWWQDGFSGDFRTQKEGWFGHATYSGGADKLGHFYMNYAGTRLVSQLFEWVGNEESDSRRLASALMIGAFTGVEVLDGLSRKWRFSREDVVMNLGGVGLALLMETRPELDRLFDFRIHYWPSKGSGFEPFGDYSGQTYLLVAKASGMPALREHRLLRYLEFAVGYGTRGYDADARGGGVRGDRNIYVGISLNVSALLDDKVFRESGKNSAAQRAAHNIFEFIQLPGTAIGVKHTLD